MDDCAANMAAYLAAGISLVAATTVYYWLKVVKPVELYSKSGSAFTNFLRENMPIVNEIYYPTIWCFESRFQTVFASFVRAMIPDISYKREILKLSDGGEVVLDWLDNARNNRGEGKDYSGPIVVLLPGLTGHSQSEYIKSFANVASKKLNARAVVFNFRGRGGHTLTTPKTYCASKGHDLDEVLAHIKSEYPKAPVMALGVSLGGILLSNYLAQQGEAAREKLTAAMVVSICFDCLKGTASLERYGLNRMLNWHLANCLVQSIKEVRHHFDSNALWDLEKVFSSATIREFDSRFTTHMFGYSDVNEYYTDATMVGKLDRIKIPYLAINAKDDPFQPGDSLPLAEASETKYAAILTTEYGGHIGFMEGILPTKYCFSDRVFEQYASGIFGSLDRVDQF